MRMKEQHALVMMMKEPKCSLQSLIMSSQCDSAAAVCETFSRCCNTTTEHLHRNSLFSKAYLHILICATRTTLLFTWRWYFCVIFPAAAAAKAPNPSGETEHLKGDFKALKSEARVRSVALKWVKIEISAGPERV